jgi:hypothetical protein
MTLTSVTRHTLSFSPQLAYRSKLRLSSRHQCSLYHRGKVSLICAPGTASLNKRTQTSDRAIQYRLANGHFLRTYLFRQLSMLPDSTPFHEAKLANMSSIVKNSETIAPSRMGHYMPIGRPGNDQATIKRSIDRLEALLINQSSLCYDNLLCNQALDGRLD